ncbi:rRNA pseudouridine synthase [Candidatus Sumerlaeota bacterium]|nr:rRNA pseudouridine synthase [Candidatus Sumerlaeota bacterium]
MRISRYLARCGIASRRDSEAVVLAGRVKVNGVKQTNLATQVAEGDHVMLDGRLLELPPEHLTLLMNKPTGVMVTREDPEGRQTIYDVLPPEFAHRTRELVYAGRLDYNTSGLLIMTTNGELANKLVHPRYHVDKTYRVRTERQLAKDALQKLRGGVALEEGRTKPCVVRQLGDHANTFEITLQEGKNRQVRRMVEEVGGKVIELERIRIGHLKLRDYFPDGKPGTVALGEKDVKSFMGNPTQ